MGDMPKMRTPVGVAIVAFVYALIGILCIFGSGALTYLPVTSDFIVLGGSFLLILGVLFLILSYGLWTGKSWAFYAFMLVQGIDFLLAFSSKNLLGLAISGLLLWYFYSRRAWFGIR